MIGGFLGAGKTSAILRLAKWLTVTKGLRVGIITNDQAEGLVDTALAKNAAFDTSEIPGGCFCCRSDALVKAAEQLTSSTKPDVFLAEPVGSCTDLVATVSLPLRQVYRKNYDIAPMSVLIDPFRAMRVLNAQPVPEEGGPPADGSFSLDVDYIYKKQLEEAEVIVVNKMDVFPGSRIGKLRELISKNYPSAELLFVSARSGEGMEQWFELLLSRTLNVRHLMDVDYARYGRGEAKLGWFNGTYSLSSQGSSDLDANQILRNLAGPIKEQFVASGLEIAHFKATVTHWNEDPSFLAAIQWVSNEMEPELTIELTHPIQRAHIILNLRAEGDPEQLGQVVETAVNRMRPLFISNTHTQQFRPAQPTPLYRIDEVPLPPVFSAGIVP